MSTEDELNGHYKELYEKARRELAEVDYVMVSDRTAELARQARRAKRLQAWFNRIDKDLREWYAEVFERPSAGVHYADLLPRLKGAVEDTLAERSEKIEGYRAQVRQWLKTRGCATEGTESMESLLQMVWAEAEFDYSAEGTTADAAAEHLKVGVVAERLKEGWGREIVARVEVVEPVEDFVTRAMPEAARNTGPHPKPDEVDAANYVGDPEAGRFIDWAALYGEPSLEAEEKAPADDLDAWKAYARELQDQLTRHRAYIYGLEVAINGKVNPIVLKVEEPKKPGTSPKA